MSLSIGWSLFTRLSMTIGESDQESRLRRDHEKEGGSESTMGYP